MKSIPLYYGRTRVCLRSTFLTRTSSTTIALECPMTGMTHRVGCAANVLTLVTRIIAIAEGASQPYLHSPHVADLQ